MLMMMIRIIVTIASGSKVEQQVRDGMVGIRGSELPLRAHPDCGLCSAKVYSNRAGRTDHLEPQLGMGSGGRRKGSESEPWDCIVRGTSEIASQYESIRVR